MNALLILLFPFIELWFIIQIGGVIGATTAILLIILTAILGFNLIRYRGMETFNKTRSQFRDRQFNEDIIETMLFIGGALALIIPGFITDFFGLILLVPIVRRLLGLRIGKYLVVNRHTTGDSSHSTRHPPNTIEGDFTRED